MTKKFEVTYGKTVKGLFYAINPLKKKVLKTYCTVHKFINLQAVDILKNEGYIEESNFFRKYIKALNEGVTWADQDFKSSNHFFHYEEGKGLYGFSDALSEAKRYFYKSLMYAKEGDVVGSIFYLGATCHLIQDSTVPQHVNNKLLKSHRNFELWVISRVMSDYSFEVDNGIIRYEEFSQYIKNNAIAANNTFLRYKHITNKEERYSKIAEVILKLAQRTTAGLLLDYYEEVIKK